MSKVILGEVLFNGEVGTAIREVYENCWKFTIVTGGERHVLLTY